VISLPREYGDAELEKFFGACTPGERVLFGAFLFTGFREQEVVHLFWPDVNFTLDTIRVTAKPEPGFWPKRWEEREVPVVKAVIELLRNHPRRENCRFVFPSPAGNREWHMLDRCKQIAKRAGLDEKKWDLKTFRSTYATLECFVQALTPYRSALDGTQVAGNDDAILGAGQGCARAAG
jgi:hypothetical protein